ncbi:MAG: DUF2971 domain-containing protein [Lachnospiraceae bacterium]|nr:DUF2971 domain-containing protein [Lachnospiraceae bacterium]
MENRPLFIYKYKSIASKLDLVRLLDTIKNNRIYMPRYKQLNDPLEGEVVNIEIEGYAGISMKIAADEEEPIIANVKDDFRILSFSSEYENPQLWAHYANDYDGVCLCFSTDNTFRDIEELEYCNKRDDVYAENDEILRSLVRKSFYKKNDGWGYEKEWRLVKETSEDYLQYGSHELKGVILGHNISEEIRSFIIDNINDNIMIMRTIIGHRSFRVKILPEDYEYDYDGSPLCGLDMDRTLQEKRFIYEKEW